MEALLEAQDLNKSYGQVFSGEQLTSVLKQVNFQLHPGEFVALMGPSGCGKSTLLNVCGAMDTLDSGSLRIGQQYLVGMDDSARTLFRRKTLGFVFQFFNLLESLTVSENIAVPLQLQQHEKIPTIQAKVSALLERVGLAHRREAYPNQLSGGEMQRVAIARALVHKPLLLLADEPTGNLDSEAGTVVLELLRSLNKEDGLTILMATHSQEAALYASRTLRMRDGRLLPEYSQSSAAVTEFC